MKLLGIAGHFIVLTLIQVLFLSHWDLGALSYSIHQTVAQQLTENTKILSKAIRTTQTAAFSYFVAWTIGPAIAFSSA